MRPLTSSQPSSILKPVSDRPNISFAEIAARKQASRDEDARALASNEKSREELRRENAILSPYGRAQSLKLIGMKPLR